MLDHAEYWVKTLGPEHTGIGLDFTEGYQEAHRAGKLTMKPPKWRTLRPDIFGTAEEFYTQRYPQGLGSISQLPNFTHGLMARGYDAGQIREIMGESWLRNFESVVG